MKKGKNESFRNNFAIESTKSKHIVEKQTFFPYLQNVSWK